MAKRADSVHSVVTDPSAVMKYAMYACRRALLPDTGAWKEIMKVWAEESWAEEVGDIELVDEELEERDAGDWLVEEESSVAEELDL